MSLIITVATRILDTFGSGLWTEYVPVDGSVLLLDNHNDYMDNGTFMCRSVDVFCQNILLHILSTHLSWLRGSLCLICEVCFGSHLHVGGRLDSGYHPANLALSSNIL